MATKTNAKKPSKLKPFLIVVGVIVGLYLLFMGLMMASDWKSVREYKSLALKLDQKMGGGYQITSVWKCSIDTSGCPYVTITKVDLVQDLSSAREKLETIKNTLKDNGFEIGGVQSCKEEDGKLSYCGLGAKNKDAYVTAGLGNQFINITISKK